MREKNGLLIMFAEEFATMDGIETDGISGDGDKLELVQGRKVVKAGEIYLWWIWTALQCSNRLLKGK